MTKWFLLIFSLLFTLPSQASVDTASDILETNASEQFLTSRYDEIHVRSSHLQQSTQRDNQSVTDSSDDVQIRHHTYSLSSPVPNRQTLQAAVWRYAFFSYFSIRAPPYTFS